MGGEVDRFAVMLFPTKLIKSHFLLQRSKCFYYSGHEVNNCLYYICRLRTRRRSAKDDEHIYDVPDIAPDKCLPHHFDMSLNAAYGEVISPT